MAALVTAATVATVGVAVSGEQRQFAARSYFLPASLRAAVGQLPGSGCIVLEGFGDAGPTPRGEAVLAYAAADEQAWGRVSLTADNDDNLSLAYFALPRPAGLPDPFFCPSYETVLTRAAGVLTHRRLSFRSGPIAVEGRASPLDVLIDGGVRLPLTGTQAAAGVPLALMPLFAGDPGAPTRFVVTGDGPGATYVDLVVVLRGSHQALTVASDPTAVLRRHGSRVDVCLEAAGAGESQTRIVEVRISASPPAILAGMSASTGSCVSG